MLIIDTDNVSRRQWIGGVMNRRVGVTCFGVLLAEPFDARFNKGVFIFLVAAVLRITEAVHLTATALLLPSLLY